MSHNEADSYRKVEEALFVEHVEMLMVNVTDSLNTKIDEVNMHNYNEQEVVVYPRAEEELIRFLKRCKIKDSKVMLCPCYSPVFNKQAAKEVEKLDLGHTNQGGLVSKTNDEAFSLTRGESIIEYTKEGPTSHQPMFPYVSGPCV